jgi:adenylate cyclase
MDVQPCQSHRDRRFASFGNSAVSETRKLAAILVADVVGYSRLAGADEDRTLARLRTLRSDLIDPTIAVHHGRVVKRTGDGSIIEFRSVVDAVNCAIEIQRAMVERNAEVAPDKRIQFRIGIHLGDVVEESDGDLMGDGVNIAARLQSVANPGAICFSEQAYWQVKGRLDLKVSELGATQLKNIVEPVHVYSLEAGQPAQSKPAPEGKPLAPPEKRAPVLRWPVVAALAVAVLTAGAYGWHAGIAPRLPRASVAEERLKSAPRLSIVVLPFANLGGSDEEHLVDGITDDLTTDLSRMHDSFVIARNTAFAYKGKAVDAKTIGRELGVRYALEGSVRGAGDKVGVNAQLISTETGAHIWADRFEGDRSKTGLEVVARLARSLDHALVREEGLRLTREGRSNPDAVDLRLRGEAILWAPNANISTLKDAVGLLDRAVAIDPRNVRTMTMLAAALALRTDLSTVTPLSTMGTGTRGTFADSDLWRAEILLDSALALDPNDTWAHWTKGYVFSMRGQWTSALREAERAIEDDRNNPMAYAYAGFWKMNLGRSADGVADVETALRLSPRDPQAPQWQNFLCYLRGHLAQWDQAIKECERAVAANPGNDGPLGDLTAAYAWAGRDDEARETARQLKRLDRNHIQFLRTYSDVHDNPTFKAEVARIIEGLRKAGLPEE